MEKPEPRPSGKRAKPTFTVPDDAGSAKTAEGWVYRDPDAEFPVPPTLLADSLAPLGAEKNTRDQGVAGAVAGVLILGCTAAGLAAFAVIRLLDIPAAAARGILSERRRPL